MIDPLGFLLGLAAGYIIMTSISDDDDHTPTAGAAQAAEAFIQQFASPTWKPSLA